MGQQPWVFNGTLRDNVTLGHEHGDGLETRYAEAVRCAQLDADIEMLPGGDATEIGERGINLSGGQKTRVCLARAIFSDADVFLMDDPLSAVDVHVGRKIVEETITGILKSKTRLITTHQLQFLHVADRIVVRFVLSLVIYRARCCHWRSSTNSRILPHAYANKYPAGS